MNLANSKQFDTVDNLYLVKVFTYAIFIGGQCSTSSHFRTQNQPNKNFVGSEITKRDLPSSDRCSDRRETGSAACSSGAESLGNLELGIERVNEKN